MHIAHVHTRTQVPMIYPTKDLYLYEKLHIINLQVFLREKIIMF